MVKIAAIIAAAGQGKRMGRKVAKQYLSLAGRPVLWHTLRKFTGAGIFDEIVLVVSKKDLVYCRKNLLTKYNLKDVRLVTGGRERQDSVYQGLQSLGPCDYVAIHDGVRCLVSTRLIKDTVKAVRRYGAVTAAVPLKDTVKESTAGGLVTRTIDRSRLWSVQTPQVFKYKTIMAAYEKARRDGFTGTDDAMLVERAGQKVKLVMGSYNNIKITTAIDLETAAIIIKKGLG